MKTYPLKLAYLTVICLCITLNIIGKEPLKFRSSLNYYRDLSDTYGKGSMLSGDLAIARDWYGASSCFGYFQGHSTFIYNIIIEEINKTIKIQFDEVSIMQSSAISLMILPIQKEWLQLDIEFGAALNVASSSQFNNVDYSYDLIQDRFTYLFKDYKLVNRTHFGYQVGFNLSFFVLPKIGMQVSSRIQDLSNGGTFFFVGGSLFFEL